MTNTKEITPFTVINWIASKRAPDNVFDIINESSNKAYNAFIINRHFSKFLDLIFYANEINSVTNSSSPNVMQYAFYNGVIGKGSRFIKWDGKKKDNSELINMIQQKYGYSSQVAMQVLPLFKKEQIVALKQEFDTGGRKNGK